MDTLIQSYMEETEDMLQRAEECLIRLETEVSPDDVNELFRIAHTIKGSSHMVGYEEIGNIMHKIEDMLDCARNGTIQFDQRIVSLCFDGLDIVKRMLQDHKEGSQEIGPELLEAASRINHSVESYLRANRPKEEKIAVEPCEMGIVASLLSQRPRGKNKYYITFFLEEDAPMVSPVFIMILKSVEAIGTLAYASVTDSYFSQCSMEVETRTLEIILCTDIEEAELYTYFALSYVEKINIVDLTRSKLEARDYSFNNRGDTASYLGILKVFMELYQFLFSQSQGINLNQEALAKIEALHREAVDAYGGVKGKISAFIQDFEGVFSQLTIMAGEEKNRRAEHFAKLRKEMDQLIERAYHFTKGKHIFSVYKPDKEDFINRLNSFMGMVNKSSTLLLLIDLSKLKMLHGQEVKALIEIKKQMMAQNISIGIVVEGLDSRRIINIFDAIRPVEEFNLFRSELDAILWMFQSQEALQRIKNKG